MADAESLRLSAEMDLAELRQAMRFSQNELAQTLQIGQAGVAKIEKRTDMYMSTLRRFIEAMGGELEIVAKFPGNSVRIKSFQDINKPTKVAE
jgi:predicted transcriptional regulator